MDRENRRFLKKLSICMAVLFVVVTAVSLFVMNFTPLNRLIGGYKEQKLDLSRAQGSNFVYSDFDGTVTVGMGYSELEFTDIDARVGSIGFDIELDDNVERAPSASISRIRPPRITAKVLLSSRWTEIPTIL